MSEEKLPVNETIHVIKYRNIYKTQKWWCAVVLGMMFGHKKVMFFIWQNRDGKWKRKNKFSVNFEKDWLSIKEATDEFIKELVPSG